MRTDEQADRRTNRWKDGRTDMRKALVPFLNFANAPKNYWVVCKILKSRKCSFKPMSSKCRTKSLKISQATRVFVAFH